MKSEILKFINSKKSMIVFMFIIVVMLIENVFIYKDCCTFFQSKSDFYRYTDVTFLCGHSRGHIAQIIIMWFLPIFMLLLYSDKTINEIKSNYYSTEMVKNNENKYIINKLLSSFVIGFMVMITALILNLLLSAILFSGGEKICVDIKPIDGHYVLLGWQNEHPLLTNIIYDLICAFFSGIIMSMSTMMGFLIKDKKITYIASFIVWFWLISTKLSVVQVLQPFTEYEVNSEIKAFIQATLLILSIIIGSICFAKKRKDYV